MGHRGRRAARRLRAGQVPRRHPAHDGHPPPGRRSRADQAGRAAHEGPVRPGRHHQSGRRLAPGRRGGVLQHVALPAARSHLARASAAVARRLRDLPLWLLAQRPGGPRQVQVPPPDSHAGGSGRAGLPGGKVSGQLDQPEPPPRSERQRLRASARAGQPRHGHRVRGADPALQRGEQRGGRGALHPAGRGAAHGAAGLPAGGRSGRVRHLPGLRRRLRHRRHADRRGRDADATGRRARQGGVGPPLRPGGEPGDLRHQQGRPHTQGRRRRGGQRAVRLHPLRRRLSSPRVRLHALQSALRQELEDRPGAHGRASRASRTCASSWTTTATPSIR